MPTCPIVDAHVHLWNPGPIRYPWLDDNALLNRPHLLADYRDATAGIDIDAMVFLQCEADFSQFEAEADWATAQARLDPRIKALVAWAPLEKGGAVSADLERLKRHSILRGIRRIIQFEPDQDFCLRPAFIEGVRTLPDFDLSFDICIDHRHLANTLRFVAQLPEVPMVLDHIGKPAIKDGVLEPWASQMREMAAFPNVVCKLSGVATEADHANWRDDDLRRYIDAAIEAFGFGRLMFGGDWPVCTQAIAYRRWVDLLDTHLTGIGARDQANLWRDNALRFYRIAL